MTNRQHHFTFRALTIYTFLTYYVRGRFNLNYRFVYLLFTCIYLYMFIIYVSDVMVVVVTLW